MRLSFKQNLGSVDRAVRIAIGTGLITAVYNRTGLFPGTITLLGASQLLEGAAGY